MFRRSSHSPLRCSALFAACVAVLGTGVRDAAAWTFPEHGVLTEEGLRYLPPPARRAIAGGLSKAASEERGSVLSSNLCDRFLARYEVDGDAPIPYVALPAIAADHATSLREMVWYLEDPAGAGTAKKLVAGAREYWSDFLEAVRATPTKSVHEVSENKRTDLARAVNLFAQYTDPVSDRYKRHGTHLHVADESLTWLVSGLGKDGRVDNVVAQFLVHHLRSLELAVLARGGERSTRARDAFLEHAMALHFLEDAFAAGHAVMTRSYLTTLTDQRGRHDFFSRNGLGVTWAGSRGLCAADRTYACPSLDPEAAGDVCPLPQALAPCWTTYGDGFLGDSADEDRLHVTEAVARAQIQLAMALDPSWAKALIEDNPADGTSGDAPCVSPSWVGQRAGSAIDLTFALLDPEPSWAVTRPGSSAAPRSAKAVIQRALDALDALGAPAHLSTFVKEVPANTSDPVLGAVPAAWVDDPLAISPRDRGDKASPAISLVRPLLLVWPVPTSPPDSQQGKDDVDVATAFQLWGSLSGNAYWDGVGYRGTAVRALAGAGIVVRAGNLVPRISNASFVDASIGWSFSAFITPEARVETSSLAFGELRIPILNHLVWFWLRGEGWAWSPDWLSFVPNARLYVDFTDTTNVRAHSVDFQLPGILIPWTGSGGSVSSLPMEIHPRLGLWLSPTGFFGAVRGGTLSLEVQFGFSERIARLRL